MDLDERKKAAERYSRQTIIKDIGEEGQRKLSGATVGIFGVGGLGCPAATYLVAAGIGRLILADHQRPTLSDLNRQFLHWPQDIKSGKSKVSSAAWKLNELNPGIDIDIKDVLVTAENIGSVFSKADMMVDCLDSFVARFVLNDHCVKKGIPFVHAAVEGFGGQLTTVIPGRTPCLRCLFSSEMPKKGPIPVLGATAGVFGAMEAAEVIKFITGTGNLMASTLLVGDLARGSWENIEISRSKDCKVCSVPSGEKIEV